MDSSVVVFVLGGPGTGKGTHCTRLKNKYGWVHLSTGDLFRAEVQRGTEQGKLLADIMNEGDMAPPEITLGLLEAAMKESTSKKFLFDGFPRAMEQVFGYQEWFGRQGQAVLFLTCTEAVMTERIMARAQGRDDDNPETIQKRLEKFSDVSMPVIEWYRSHTDMLKTIDATRSLEQVAKDVDAYISGLEAKLGIASAAPAAAAAARAPVAPEPADDLICLDNSIPSQAPMFLDLDGEPDAPTPLDDSKSPSPMDALDALSSDLQEASVPDSDDPFAAATPAAEEEETPKPASSTPDSAVAPATTVPSAAAVDDEGTDLRPLVIIGPSGVGKASVVGRFMARHAARFGFTVSHTTREPRPGEQDGKDYHFVTREEMQQAISEGKFLEHAEVHGNLYGTSIAAVRTVKEQGKTAILEIDVQGAMQVRAGPHGSSGLFVFIAPPSMEVLEQRLRGRGTEAEETVQLRLANARSELDASKKPGFVDEVIVNEDLDTTVAQLEGVVVSKLPTQHGSEPRGEAELPPTGHTAPGRSPDVTGREAGARGGQGGDEAACRGTGAQRSEPSAEAASGDAHMVLEGDAAAPGTAVKQYLQDTVAGAVEEAMLALVKARPADPMQFLIDHLFNAKAQRDA